MLRAPSPSSRLGEFFLNLLGRKRTCRALPALEHKGGRARQPMPQAQGEIPSKGRCVAAACRARRCDSVEHPITPCFGAVLAAPDVAGLRLRIRSENRIEER